MNGKRPAADGALFFCWTQRREIARVNCDEQESPGIVKQAKRRDFVTVKVFVAREGSKKVFGGGHETTGEDQQRSDEKSGAGDCIGGRRFGFLRSGHGVSASTRVCWSASWRPSSSSRICCAAAVLWAGVRGTEVRICLLSRSAGALLGCAVRLLAVSVVDRVPGFPHDEKSRRLR